MKNDKSLTTSNNFIKARYEITEQELKLVFAMFYKLQDNDNEKNIKGHITFTSQELSYWLGIDKKQYHNIKLITKRLMKRVLSIEDDEKKMFKMCHFVSYAEYQNGILELKPDEYLLKHFLFLKEKFTKIPIATLLQLKNVYAIKMYNLLLEYKNIRTVITLDIDEFRILFQIENKYLKTRDFKRDVLDIVKNELNNVISDLNFDFYFEKENRCYKKITFTYNTEALLKNDISFNNHLEAVNKFYSVCNNGLDCDENYSPSESSCRYCKIFVLKKNKIKI